MSNKVREMDNFESYRNQPIEMKDINPKDIKSNFIKKI